MTPSSLAALSRRAWWKLHWALRSEPLVVRSWWDGMTIELPHSGSAATAFYRTFPSQEIADWMLASLRPGMAVVDVGAHVGVYSLLAARLVEEEGVVHAIEPQEELLAVVVRNAERNGLRNVRTHCLVLADADGTAGLAVDPRSRGAFTAAPDGSGLRMVPATTLEAFARREGLDRIGLVKLDAAGNELAVLRGARALLEEGAVERVVCKLYHPDVVAARFGAGGGTPRRIVEHLEECGYTVGLTGGGSLERSFEAGAYTIAALATR